MSEFGCFFLTNDGMNLKEPKSPEHSKPREFSEPEQKLNIDLNPELSESDSGDAVGDDGEDVIVQKPVHEEGGFINNNQGSNNIIVDESDDNEYMSDVIDLRNKDTITSIFEEAYEQVAQEFHHPPLTSGQHSGFVNNTDEQLLKIQRKFVKTQSGETYHSLLELINGLFAALKVIWLSINPNSTSALEYFIKILNDLEDYISHYDIVPELFELCQFIDVRLSFLMDKGLFSRTQLIRVTAIVNRLRMMIITKVTNPSPVYEIEVSKLFEGILERS